MMFLIFSWLSVLSHAGDDHDFEWEMEETETETDEVPDILNKILPSGSRLNEDDEYQKILEHHAKYGMNNQLEGMITEFKEQFPQSSYLNAIEGLLSIPSVEESAVKYSDSVSEQCKSEQTQGRNHADKQSVFKPFSAGFIGGTFGSVLGTGISTGIVAAIPVKTEQDSAQSKCFIEGYKSRMSRRKLKAVIIGGSIPSVIWITVGVTQL